MYLRTAETLIKKHEGLRLEPYKCTAGKLTIGYGRNLDDNGISPQEADYMLAKDIAQVDEQLNHYTWFKTLNDSRKAVLVDMTFNLGLPRLLKFEKMLGALIAEDYQEAANQMLDSRWANQVGQRATRLAQIMRDGVAQQS